MPKFTFQVTIDVIDPGIYTLDQDGQKVGPPFDKLDKTAVAGYFAEAVRMYGGCYAPGDPFYPFNIKTVRVRSRLGGKIDMIAGALKQQEPETDDDV